MRKSNEKGAIVVEAVGAMSIFVFIMFTVLYLINVCYIQSKLSIALDSAAKQISQYSYLYYKFKLDEFQSEINQGLADEQKLANNTIDGMGTLVENLSKTGDTLQSFSDVGDMEALQEKINELEQNGQNLAASAAQVRDLATTWGDSIARDPKGFIMGMGKMAISDLSETGKAVLAQVLATAIMKNNIVSSDGDADAFLKSHGIVDGMKGLDFTFTHMMAYGTSKDIQLVCTFDVQMLKLLDIDFKFHIRIKALTEAWGNGVSLIKQDNPVESIWTSMGDMRRGSYIVSEEKEAYQYTGTKSGFDAYDASRNEFVTITSINTFSSTYSGNNAVDALTKRIERSYTAMKTKVDGMGETIKVSEGGTAKEVTSDVGSRNYKVIVVVPEDSDLTSVNAAISNLRSKYPDVTFEVKTGYGSAKPEDTSDD